MAMAALIAVLSLCISIFYQPESSQLTSPPSGAGVAGTGVGIHLQTTQQLMLLPRHIQPYPIDFICSFRSWGIFLLA